MGDKLQLPSADALAIVASNLALKSKYLQDKKDLTVTFWFFYDLLADEAKRRQAYQDSVQENKESALRMAKSWEEMRPIIMPLLQEAEKRGLKAYALNALTRAYKFSSVRKLPSELSDDELMKLGHIGPVLLANIRSVFPLPS